MSVLHSLIRKKAPSIAPSDPANGVGVIFDSTLQEIDSRETQIATYATESSLYGNDHAVHKNPTLQIRVGVSDNPIKVSIAQASSVALSSSSVFSDALNTATGAAASYAAGIAVSSLSSATATAVGTAAEASVSAYAISNRRSVDVYNALDKMRLNQNNVNYVGTKRDYIGYRIVRLREVIDKDTECGGIFDISLEKPRIFTTSSSSTEINNNLRSNDDASTRGQATNNIGQVGVSSES